MITVQQSLSVSSFDNWIVPPAVIKPPSRPPSVSFFPPLLLGLVGAGAAAPTPARLSLCPPARALFFPPFLPSACLSARTAAHGAAPSQPPLPCHRRPLLAAVLDAQGHKKGVRRGESRGGLGTETSLFPVGVLSRARCTPWLSRQQGTPARDAPPPPVSPSTSSANKKGRAFARALAEHSSPQIPNADSVDGTTLTRRER